VDPICSRKYGATPARGNPKVSRATPLRKGIVLVDEKSISDVMTPALYFPSLQTPQKTDQGLLVRFLQLLPKGAHLTFDAIGDDCFYSLVGFGQAMQVGAFAVLAVSLPARIRAADPSTAPNIREAISTARSAATSSRGTDICFTSFLTEFRRPRIRRHSPALLPEKRAGPPDVPTGKDQTG
jgi:hypothetical protein